MRWWPKHSLAQDALVVLVVLAIGMGMAYCTWSRLP